ncbi:hypothetical protein ACLKA6_019879 [Drosophila palustris]
MEFNVSDLQSAAHNFAGAALEAGQLNVSLGNRSVLKELNTNDAGSKLQLGILLSPVTHWLLSSCRLVASCLIV